MMKVNLSKFRNIALLGAYLYLALPMVVFLLGWCKWYIGIPAAALVVCAIVLCMREHIKEKIAQPYIMDVDKKRVVGILVIITIWVVMSGVGGLVWQNSDHWWRNQIFDILVTQEWPVIKTIDLYGTIMDRGIVYYIGFWFVPAFVGKLLGIGAGYAAQAVWAVLGIVVFYMLICIWRKKVVIWPLVLFIFFSGLDVVGMNLAQLEEFKVLGDKHLEAWSFYYQFSCMTTQLFWVFNQAIPAWVACGLIFLVEKPKNMIFVISLVIVHATFPFVGMVPYTLYYMITRGDWQKEYHKVSEVAGDVIKNWMSIQNVLAGGIIAIISVIYVFGNTAAEGIVSIFFELKGLILILAGCVCLVIGFCIVTKFALMGKGKPFAYLGIAAAVGFAFYRISSFTYNDWHSPVFWWANLTMFYFLEVGVFFLCVYSQLQEKKLFWLNLIWLYIIPTILIGTSIDFCMRASIPGLVLTALWCIRMLDEKKEATKYARIALIALLIVGAVTPWHEMKRTYSNSLGYYENTTVHENDIYAGWNFSGSPETFFWKYIAK